MTRRPFGRQAAMAGEAMTTASNKMARARVDLTIVLKFMDIFEAWILPNWDISAELCTE